MSSEASRTCADTARTSWTDGEGCRATLQCPYHAWTYDLDGTLLRAPRSEREPGFDPDAFSLLPASVEIWGPLLFANADPEARPLSDVLEGVTELVGDERDRVRDARFRERVTWELEVNWKNGLENYLECYHCPTAHPGLSKLVDVDPDSYALIPRALSTSQVSAVRPGVREGKVKAPYIPATDVDDAQYHFLWPATTINIEPGRPNLGIDAWIPAGPGKTVGVSDYYFGPDVTDAEVAELVAFSQQVGRGGRWARAQRPGGPRFGRRAAGAAAPQQRASPRALPSARVRRSPGLAPRRLQGSSVFPHQE